MHSCVYIYSPSRGRRAAPRRAARWRTRDGGIQSILCVELKDLLYTSKSGGGGNDNAFECVQNGSKGFLWKHVPQAPECNKVQGGVEVSALPGIGVGIREFVEVPEYTMWTQSAYSAQRGEP